MTRPTYGSLFSGVGGMDMGFDTHMDCVFQVEWDKHAQSILARHWPDVPKWSDVQDVNGAEIPPCDVLTFGSPCQDLSVAGKRAGLDGGRSSMFYEAVRIIKEMRDATNAVYPRIAVWENVPGALSSNRGEDFAAVLQALADSGAVLQEYAVLDAQHFGVPQRRRRVFLVAVFDSAIADRCPDPLLPVAEGRPRDFAKGRKKGEDPAGRSEDGSTDGRGYRMLGFGHYADDDCASALKQRDYKDATDLAVIPVIFDGTRHDVRMDSEIVPTLKQRMGTGGGQVPMLAEPVALVTHDVVGTLQSRSHKGVNHEGARDGQLVIEVEPVYGYDEYNDSITPELHHALRAGTRQSVGVVQPVAASFKPGASANAYGIGYEEEIAPTLESGGGGNNKPAVMQPVTVFQPGTMVRLGGGVWEDTVPTLRAEAKRGDNEPHISQPYSFDTQFVSNANVFTDLSPTLKASQQSPSVTTHTYVVRRLTPLECERLMGWPDDHTRYTADGKEQADTHRYKQCGNGVASPVARWIAGHLARLMA